MKKMKKIMAAAIAMMTFSTAAAVTGTVAWFTASNMVNVSGMNIQAEVETGIVIANETRASESDWHADAVTASHDGTVSSTQQKFIPTSTGDVTTWYHANSTQYDHGQQGLVYTDYSVGGTNAITESSDGIGSIGANQNIYLLNKFYVKTSSTAALSAQDLYITNISASGSSVSVNLNKSLRLAVKLGSEAVKIFAPIATETASYTAGGETAVTLSSGKTDLNANGIEIPNNQTNSPLEIKTYIYFEGEDINNKSSNITATLDNLSVSFTFGNEAHA